jgi:hypothetical protein
VLRSLAEVHQQTRTEKTVAGMTEILLGGELPFEIPSIEGYNFPAPIRAVTYHFKCPWTVQVPGSRTG